MRRYIRVDKKSDIDTSKIHINNINERYIDALGNRYATRFNLRTRKIDVVLLALGKDEATETKIRIRRERRSRHSSPTEVEETPLSLDAEEVKGLEIPNVITKYQVKDPEDFNFDSYFLSLEVELPKYLGRMRGLIRSLQKFEKYDSTEELGEEFIITCENTFERIITELISDAQNLTVEMSKYPKPASAYLVHLSKEQRKLFDDLEGEVAKDHFLRATMICNELFKAFEISLEMLDKIIITGYTFDEKDIPKELESQFNDFLMTAGFVKGNIIQELGNLKMMYQQAMI